MRKVFQLETIMEEYMISFKKPFSLRMAATIALTTMSPLQHIKADFSIVDTLASIGKNAPKFIKNAGYSAYEGLQSVGGGTELKHAFEGAARIGAAWAAWNGFQLWYDYYRQNGPLSTLQEQLKTTPSEKLNMGDVKLALREHNQQKLRLALQNLNIEQEIAALEKCKQQLAPYLTIGGLVGMPQEIKIPLLTVYPNRFIAALERIYKYKVTDTSLQSAYTLQEKINNLTLDQLEQMEKAVERHLGKWGRVWAFITVKPTYGFAAEMYWNCIAKIAYLRKCAALLGGGHPAVTIVHHV